MKLLKQLLNRKKEASSLLVSPSQQKGNRFEQLAEKYLINEGLVLLERNYHCRYGEIDLIMRDDSTLVFVEVRYRNQRQYGGAIESVGRHKKARLIKAANYYLTEKKLHDEYACRFDVVAFESEQLNWIPAAFD